MKGKAQFTSILLIAYEQVLGGGGEVSMLSGHYIGGKNATLLSRSEKKIANVRGRQLQT